MGASSLLTLGCLYVVLYCLDELENESNYNRASLISKISTKNGGLLYIVTLSVKTIICTVDLTDSTALLYALAALLAFDLL